MPVLTLQDKNNTDRNNIIIEPQTPNGKWLLCLHGGFGTPDLFKDVTGLRNILPNHYLCFADADDTTNNLWRSNNLDKLDVEYLINLLYEFTSAYNLSYENGGVIGVSNGAMMGLRLLSVIDEMGIGYMISVSGTYNAIEKFDFKGRVLFINSVHDRVVPYMGSALYKSVDETIEVVKDSALITETVMLNEKVENDNNFDYHKWEEIKMLYPDLDMRIQEFVGM